ncbi:unnamed protein product [marine sediment metagenome]|uniref:Uncharacterized protein n=1 Tax=marine sediment metagenome TaxID=412755 RepID=X0ZQQ1_9ZZZZ
MLNLDGYIGESTRREIEYAERTGKSVVFLEGTSTETAGLAANRLGGSSLGPPSVTTAPRKQGVSANRRECK